MLHATKRNRKRNRGPVKFGNIVSDAAELGVCRTHLWRVLSGQRHSRRLLAAYHALKSKAA